MISRSSAVAVTLLALAAPVHAQYTRLLGQPAVSADQIAFTYAGDIWMVPRAGGDARRVTSSPTVERDPHFSPDGRWLAFTGEYGGNPDVYIVAAGGGEPKRLTWHPGPDEVRGWTPDGSRVLFESTRSGVPDAEPQLWTVPVTGGLPTRVAAPRAQAGTISPDGRTLAYQQVRPWEQEMRYYRGGQNKPIQLLDLHDASVEKLPWTNSRDQQPVWLDHTVYFISDRDWMNNVWAYDTQTKQLKQVTHYTDFEVESVNAGAGAVVYEQAGDVHIYDPVTGRDQRVNIRATGDFPWAMPHAVDAAKSLTHPQLSSTGVRALFEARGDVISVPVDKGTWRNLTHSSGVADRIPVWSPHGKRIAWFSDSTGEYQLLVGDQDGVSKPRAFPLTSPSFFYDLSWSPDGTRVLFTDAGLTLSTVDLATGRETRIDGDNYSWPDRMMYPAWSPDSKWVAYTKRLPGSQFHAVFVYSLADGRSRQMTDGLSDVISPAWDKSGKYLLFLASTDFALRTGWLDMSAFERPVRRGVYLAVLTKKEPSPLLPETGDEAAAPLPDTSAKMAKADTAHTPPPPPKPVHIDFDGISQRIISLNVPTRDYAALRTGNAGQFFYIERVPNRPNVLHRYDLTTRKAIDLIPNSAVDYSLSANGKKLLYQTVNPKGAPDGHWAVVDAAGAPVTAPPVPGKGALNTAGIKLDIDPQAEWKQIFNEAWRIERDYVYVANLHGVDWAAMRSKYGQYLPYVRHRADLTQLLARMQGELALAHTFVGGGDMPKPDAQPVGLLGADIEESNGRYRFAKIYTGENWNPELQAPLSAPGVDVHTGDYLLAVNGTELRAPNNPYEPFIGTVGRQVEIRVNNRPTLDGARVITVVPIASEAALRARDWIESNRRKVDALSGGKLAYVYIPDTGNEGYTSFNRYYFAQQNKQGAVIDERFNHGGSIADYMVDIMSRKLHGYFNNRVGDRLPVTAPGAGIWGPKVLIINEMSGSGGDMFPYMFRQMHIGPLIGTKTWGGLVGWGGEPPLIDGGFISAPSTGFFDTEGKWAVENEGVAPDILVEQTPRDVLAGRDPQLERAVAEALRLLAAHPVVLKKEPPAPVKVRRP